MATDKQPQRAAEQILAASFRPRSRAHRLHLPPLWFVLMSEFDETASSEFIESASAVGGAIAGVALSLAAGPFVGSSAGAVVGRALRRVGMEIQKRLLGPRQERRIAEALSVVAERARERLDSGDQPRQGWVL